MSKPSIPKGTRDFQPAVMARRQWIFRVMREAFERSGFAPIETPAMENLTTLTGKYGEEGDKLIFKLLNNGDYLSRANEEALEKRDSKALVSSISKKALRYDLTVPFARFVVMARNDLSFPFRRYQIQTVWRGDRPGKGRYQEFTQCDADIIGSESTVCELDLTLLFHDVLTRLGVPDFRILVNDRRILLGLAEAWGAADRLTDLTVAIDKWDKVGDEGVDKELLERGFSDEVRAGVGKLFDIQSNSTDVEDRLERVGNTIGDHVGARAALADMRELVDRAVSLGVDPASIRFEPVLARGLDYYTGAIFEVRVDDAPVGSICGGGRYADLTGIFGWSGVSGVGISFGADRIYDVLEHFGVFPEEVTEGTRLLVVRVDDRGLDAEWALVRAARAAGIPAELYPDVAKLKKPLKHANDRAIPFVALQGDSERAEGHWSLKSMETGEQLHLSLEEVIAQVGSMGA
jgi:histidyl-tRNA synthetase